MRTRFRRIYIKITNICNKSCTSCSKTKRKPQHMDINTFEKATLEASKHTKIINLHIIREPLLHPRLK